jgi:energy-coupling factor transporter ATP-binding protein EcfA2
MEQPMLDIQQEIRDWLHQQPDWLQQAAEMVLLSGGVTDEDIRHLVELMKTPEGQQATSHRAFEELAPMPLPGSELRLLQVGDISGIENLGPRSPLGFGTGNLCVIYGHNGSGKSGYTRLLKRACGKPRAKELKHNVFHSPPEVSKCRIDYQVAGVARQVEWHANAAPIEDVRAMDIFDADAAVMYLTEETAGAYTPPSVALFETLAAVCDRIKTQLQIGQDRLVSALPALPTEYASTQAGITYGVLRPDLDESVLQTVIQWREEDKHALEQLTERLKVDDPTALARTKQSTKLQIDQLAGLLQNAATGFTDERISGIRALRADAVTKRRIATESAQVDSAKLDGIGTDTWRALWEAARAYSQIAYPGKDYPATEEALCVLCHQELNPNAKQRLQDFDGFVKGKLEAEAKTAERVYQQVLNALPMPLTGVESTTRSQAAGLTQDDWVDSLGEYWGQVRKSRDALLGGEVAETATSVLAPDSILHELRTRSEALEREAAQHNQDAMIFDRSQAIKEQLNLEARRWTAQQSDAIRAEVVRLKQVAVCEKWKRSANSQRISKKAGDIAEQVITQAFVDRFNRELKALGASRIKVELFKTRTEKGKSLHKLRLKGAQTGQDLPDSVLSDGERRIVGLAAFLADVAEQPHVAPFVFDDPISSLDHDFEWCVALRLADLAKSRQVLVFTHRLSLYGAMEDAAKKSGEDWKKQHLQQQCIESFSGIAGHPADQAAWNANNMKANNILLTRLGEAKKAGEDTGAYAYSNVAQGICSDFRKLLERTVEDDLLNQVVRRHRRSITTDNRLAPLPHISVEDCKFIDGLMSKYSCFEHSQSSETPSFVPEEPELREDLESLKKWREEFKKRSAGAAT